MSLRHDSCSLRLHPKFSPSTDLSHLPHVPEAAFYSYEKRDDPICLNDTRVDVLGRIMSWIDGSDKRRIFWLNGMAGTGKSTISRTIALRCHEKERLAASFFFSRGNGDLGHAGKFFTTIAFQLANNFPKLRPLILEAVASCSDISRRVPGEQWKQLILQPLSQFRKSSAEVSLVLVIDALDECDNENDIRNILRLFVESRELSNTHLRIFVTSRPETPIRLGFRAIPKAEHQVLVLHEIAPHTIDHDLFIYFRRQLDDIRERWYLDRDWICEQEINDLVRNAGGLFQWAATAHRYIYSGREFARERLYALLQESPSDLPPERNLDQIYTKILQQSLEGDYNEQETRRLCAQFEATVGPIITIFDPLPSAALADLLGTTQGEIDRTLWNLHSLLSVPEDKELPVRPLHPSFRDFLLDQGRCCDVRFWIDGRKTHDDLAVKCLRVMSSLRMNMTNSASPGVLLHEIDGNVVAAQIPKHVQYACRYWVDHLQQGGSIPSDDSPVHAFLKTHLLHWFEALSLMGKTSDAVAIVAKLDAMLQVSHFTMFEYSMGLTSRNVGTQLS